MTNKQEYSLLKPWLLLGIAFGSFIIIGAAPGILNVAWRYMQDTFHVSDDSLGILLTAGTIGGLSTTFSSGQVINRLGLGRFLLFGCLLGAAGAMGIFVAPSFGALLVVLFVMTIGTSMIDAGMNNFVAANYGRGPMNWLHAFFGIGQTIGPVIVTFFVITLNSSWRSSYLVIIAMMLIAGGAIAFTLSQWRMPVEFSGESSETPEHERAKAASIRESMFSPAMLASMLLFGLFGGVEIGTGQLLNTLFVDGRSIAEDTSSFWISFFWGSFTVGRMVFGSIGERFSNTNLMRGATIGAVAGMFLLWINPIDGIGFFGLALVGFAIGPMFATWTAETPRRVGMRHISNAIGFQLSGAVLGGTVLAGAAGLLVKATSPDVIAPFLFFNTVALLVWHEVILWNEARQERLLAAAPSGD